MITSQLLGLGESEFVKSFEIAIQLGAIAAVAVLYWRRLLVNKTVFIRTAVAFIPTAIIGLALYKIVKTYLLASTQLVGWSLLLGGVALIGIEYYFAQKKNLTHVEATTLNSYARIEELTLGRAALIGVAQSLALVPGVSRSAATIIGGQLLGLSRTAVVEFSFLLAIPTMAAATGLDLIKNFHSFTQSDLTALLIGAVTAFVVAFLSVKFLLSYIQKHSFVSFGIYRIVAGTLVLLFLN